MAHGLASDKVGNEPGSGVPGTELSVVAPAHNEEANVEPLVDEVGAALSRLGNGFEFIIMDDGSTDRTRERVKAMMATRPWLRCVAMNKHTTGEGKRTVGGVSRRIPGSAGTIGGILGCGPAE